MKTRLLRHLIHPSATSLRRSVLAKALLPTLMLTGGTAQAGYTVRVSGSANAFSNWLSGSNRQEAYLPDWGPGGNIAAASGGGDSSPYNNTSASSATSINIPTLTISGHATATLSTVRDGAYMTPKSDASSVANMTIISGDLDPVTGNMRPYLFRITGAASGFLDVSYGAGSGPLRLSGNNVNASVITSILQLYGQANGNVATYPEDSAHLPIDKTDQTSYFAHLEIDENVVRPLNMDYLYAPPGQLGAVVTYPPRTTYTGLTEAQFTNVESITYSPPAGTVLTYGANGNPYGYYRVNWEVKYKWGAVQNDGSYTYVVPGFAPSNITAATYHGQPRRVYFSASSLPPGVVGQVLFDPPSGSVFPPGETIVTAYANMPNGMGSFPARTFKVTVLEGEEWVTSGPPPELRGDTDGDGQADWVEIMAGTNLQDPADRFEVSETFRSGNDIVISWNAVGGVTYQVERFIPGSNAPGVPVGDPVTTTEARTTRFVTDPGALSLTLARFYRVRVVPQ